VKIVVITQNPTLSSQDEPIHMLHDDEISNSSLHSVEWHQTEWRFESHSCNPPQQSYGL